MKRQPTPADIATGKRIKQLRKDTRMSSDALAKAVGVSRGAVGNWELGQGIKRENLLLVAEVFKVSFDWLSTGRGSSKPRRFKWIVPDLSDLDESQMETLAHIDATIEGIVNPRR